MSYQPPTPDQIATALSLVNWPYVLESVEKNPSEAAFWAQPREGGTKLDFYPPASESGQSLTITLTGSALSVSDAPPFFSGKAEQFEFWKYNSKANAYEFLFSIIPSSAIAASKTIPSLIENYKEESNSFDIGALLQALGAGGDGTGNGSNRIPFRIEVADEIEEGSTLTVTISPATNPPREFKKAYLAFKGEGLTDEDFANADSLGIGDGLVTRISLTGGKPVEIKLDIASERDEEEARQELFQIGLFSSIRFSDNWDETPNKFQIATPVKVAIRDQSSPPTSKEPTYQSSITNRKLNETTGDDTSITLKTTNIEDGRRLFWRAEGNKTNQFGKDSVNNYDFGASGLDRREGFVTINNGRAGFSLKAASDSASEGQEIFEIVFYSDKTYKEAIHSTASIAIDDTSQYPPNLPPRITMGPVVLHPDMAGRQLNVQDLIEVSDPEADPITGYRLTNQAGPSTGYFRLGDEDFQGRTLEVDANQLRRVIWVAGQPGSVDEITLTAFDEPNAYGGGLPRPTGASRIASSQWETKPSEKALFSYANTSQGLDSILIAPIKATDLPRKNLNYLDSASSALNQYGKGANSYFAMQPNKLKAGLIDVDASTLARVGASTLIGVDGGTLIGVDGGT
jgi:hypothetical protein